MYRVSKYTDTISKFKSRPDDTIDTIMFYVWFDTFEEAKLFCINRAKEIIVNHEKEIKAAKRKLLKLEKMVEKADKRTER